MVPSPAHQGLQEHAGFTTGSFPPPDRRSRRCFLFLQEPFFSDELRRDAPFFALLPLRLLPPRLEHEQSRANPNTLDAVIVAKLRAAAGLANLETKKYKLAARKSKVIENINFRNFLELVPEVRELVNDFYASRYGSCLEHLEKLKPNLLLDIHLREHLETLYNDIRYKAIVQYTIPFISVDLNTMASAFNSSVSMLEKELAALITENKIQARIDSHNKILYARHADQRNATFQRALQTGNEFERDIKAMLLRANIIKHDFTQKNWTGPRKLNL
ncbi:COP9 signalosome complex subunit 1 [Hordeum vulgare]|nr:COP9 signalosome complex subunit 1 [Hordeum vulgare]